MPTDFYATPVLHCVSALVKRPDSFVVPPAAGASLSIGSGPMPGVSGVLYVAIQHEDGANLTAIVPPHCLPQLERLVRKAIREVGSGRFETYDSEEGKN